TRPVADPDTRALHKMLGTAGTPELNPPNYAGCPGGSYFGQSNMICSWVWNKTWVFNGPNSLTRGTYSLPPGNPPNIVAGAPYNGNAYPQQITGDVISAQYFDNGAGDAEVNATYQAPAPLPPNDQVVISSANAP